MFIINYTKNGEKYTLERMMQIRTLSKGRMFIQYRLLDSKLCATVCVCVRVFVRDSNKSGGTEEHRLRTGDRC